MHLTDRIKRSQNVSGVIDPEGMTIGKDILNPEERERAERFKQVNDNMKIIKNKKPEPEPLLAPANAPKTSKGPIDTKELGESYTKFLKKDLDLTYVAKIISELRANTHNYSEHQEIYEDYKKLTLYCMRSLEGGGFMKKMDGDKKQDITRETNRVFEAKFDKVKGLKEYIDRMVHYRLEDLKREVKDNKWKIYLLFLTEFLRANPKNRDVLEKLRLKVNCN